MLLRDAAPADPLTLLRARVHEAEGRGRRAFALFQAVRHQGPLVWVLPSHVPELPMLRGLPEGVGERLHVIRPEGEVDLLWCVEEALRSAPIALVIAEPDKPPVPDCGAPVATGRRGGAHHWSAADPRRGWQQCDRDALELRTCRQRRCGLDSAPLEPE